MQLVGQRVIGTGDSHKLGELRFHRRVLLTEHLDLPLNERNGRATPRMRQTKARQHGVMTLKEIGIVLQVSSNRLFFGFHGGYAACFSCCHMRQTST
jgi:hypothetical protein